MAVLELRTRYWALQDEWGVQVFGYAPTDWARVDAIDEELSRIEKELEGMK